MSIVVTNLSHYFGKHIIFENIGFEIYEGDKLCVIGKSGEGKSVLFKLLTGLLKPTSGSISILGENPYPLSSVISQNMGVVFQNPALIDFYNVWENIGLVDLYRNKRAEQILQRVFEILPFVGLKKEDSYKRVEELSGGMKKRVAIARALYHRPKILFFDEPHSGLDPINARVIDKLIQMIFEPNHILVMVTHDMQSVRSIANKVLLIDQHKGYFYENIQIFFQSDNPTIRSFLNSC